MTHLIKSTKRIWIVLFLSVFFSLYIVYRYNYVTKGLLTINEVLEDGIYDGIPNSYFEKYGSYPASLNELLTFYIDEEGENDSIVKEYFDEV